MMQIRALLQYRFTILVIFGLALVLYSFYISEGVHNPSLLLHHAGHLHLIGSRGPRDARVNTFSCSHQVNLDASDHSVKSQDHPHNKSCSHPHGPIAQKSGNHSKTQALNLHQGEPSKFEQASELNGRSNDKSRGTEPFESNGSLELGGRPSQEDYRRECEEKFVYIYKLPPEFNEDLVDKCGRLTGNWVPLCGNLNNNGYGPHVPTKAKALNDTNVDSLVDLEPPHAWYRTEQFSLELIFHERLRRGYPCLTQDPELASVFYIPYYAALDTAFTLFDPNLSARDRLAQRLVGWLSGNTVWKKFQGGKKHFMVLGRIAWDFSRSEEVREGWGSALLSLGELSNVTKLLIEKRPWVSNEIAIPYPTSFHPSSLQDMELWQEKLRGRMTQRRPLLCSFIGSTSRGTEWSRALRAELAKQCDQVGTDMCQEYRCGVGNMGTLDCARNPEHVHTLFLSSTFCLQPSGDSPTRKGIFDSLLAGCIPILFTNSSAYTQYMWHLPHNGSRYSFFFDGDEVIHSHIDIFSTLIRIANDTRRLRSMQEEIIQILPHIVYSFPGNHSNDHAFHDAVDVALESFLGGSSIPMLQV